MFLSKVAPVATRVYSTQFRIIGKMHLPQERGTAEFLNADERPHLAITDCAMYASGIEHPPKREDFRYRTDFAAVPKDQVAWLVGGTVGKADPNVPREERQVYLAYSNYVLSGRLMLRPNVRTSDFLVDATVRRPFQVLWGAQLMRPRDDPSMSGYPVVERFDNIVVNLRLAGGIFDQQHDRPESGVVLEEGE